MNHTNLSIGRRRLLQAGIAGAAATALPLRAQTQGDLLRIGVVSPVSGPLGIFGEGDGHVLDLVRKQTAGIVTAGGRQLKVEFIHKDTQSNPVRAAQVAKELVNADKVDLVLSTSTPETVNPVADVCEAAGIPALSTTSPWEAFYFGRGAKPGEASPFKWSATSPGSMPISGARSPPTRRWACCCRPTPTATRFAAC
jgi:branched-chain amino acid transport system substrate-binding protein